MFLRNRSKNKLHKYGMPFVLLAALVLLSVTALQTRAEKNEIGFSEALWNKPDDSPRITDIKDLSIKQEVSAEPVLWIGSSRLEDQEEWSRSMTFSNVTLQEMKNAAFELADIEASSEIEFSETYVDGNAEIWKYRNVNFHQTGTVTYYRALTVSEVYSGELAPFEGFEEAVWAKYPHREEDGYQYYGDDKDVLMTKICKEDGVRYPYGKAFEEAVREVALERELEVYEPGVQIPLQKDGEGIARIEMITLSYVDYFFEMSLDISMDLGLFSRDFDLVLTTVHTYDFPSASIQVDPPVPVFESGRTLEQGIVRNDAVTGLKLSQDSAGNPQGCSMEYYLSETMVQGTDIEEWIPGDVVSEIGNHKYLYLRTVAPAESVNGIKYSDSEILEYTLSYLSDMPESVQIQVEREENEESDQERDGVDVGDKIQLSTKSNEGIIVYTLDGTAPTFEKLPNIDREGPDRIVSDSQEALIIYLGVPHVKVNGLWYKCSASTKLYSPEEQIVVDENIYISGDISIQAQALVNGKAIGAPNSFHYSLDLKAQTAEPSAVPEMDTEVGMGDPITLLCEDQDARIFYTLNGSAPVINIVDSRLVLGSGTYECVGNTPIYVSEDFATYGGTVTITAQAVTLTEYQGKINRLKKDSAITKFTYKVGSESPVKAVTSVPATTEEAPTEVMIGDAIRLLTETPDTIIFYTLDGAEPTFDKTSCEPTGTTIRYDAMEGVIVPPMGDSSMFRITAVAHKPGLATGNISRLVFRYPQTAGAPYAVPSAGAVTEGTQVVLQTATEDALIYYEVAYDGEEPAEPTQNSNIFGASNPFEIKKETWIKAVAMKKGMHSEVVSFHYTVAEKLETPTPSVASGSVISSGTLITLTADPQATVYYTLDGSNPKEEGNTKVLVGTSVMINGSAGDAVALRTYASKTGCSDSEIGYYSYRISAYEGGIYSDHENGSTVKNGEMIHLSTDVTNAVIYYTTDGTTPTVQSRIGGTVYVYGEPGENVVVKAIAIASGTDRTISTGTFTYTIMEKLSPPVSTVPDGAVFTQVGVIELSAEAGKIYYTLNGEEPTSASTLYRKGITINRAVTIRAVAIDEDFQSSEISTYTYGFADQVAAPAADHESGELEVGTQVTFSCETEGAVIYYRTDGTEPNPNDRSGTEIYTGPITIEKATTFKVIAAKEHMQNSRVMSVGYTVREAVVEEAAEEEEVVAGTGSTGRLQSRRSFSGENAGPSFHDVVLRNASYGAVVSALEGTLPENTELRVERAQVSESAQRMVKQAIDSSYGIVASYDVKLLVNEEEIQPEGEIEIGIPIPAEYENALIQIVLVQEDGMVETFQTRRSNGVAYVKTDHLNVYSIAAPVEYHTEEEAFPWQLAAYAAAVLLISVGGVFIYQYKKMRRAQDE